MPAARSARPAASGPTCGPAHGTPGSATSPQTSLLRTAYQTSGAASASDGMTVHMSRATPRPARSTTARTIAPTHSTARAGASDGADATTATSRRDAAPAPDHDRCATDPA